MTTAKTLRFDIFMAGDIAQAKQVCREYCFELGFCVHIEPVSYIYTGAEEDGFKIGIINYPRFPSDDAPLAERASELANLVMTRLCQHSYTIVGPHETTWFTRRTG